MQFGCCDHVPATPPEAAGARAGRAEDASEGMPRQQDSAGNVWAWNAATGEWQRLHTVQWGDTLWNLSASYYGTPSLAGVRGIHGVPQNRAIQGDSPDSGLIPGDVILIPGLSTSLAQPTAGPVPEPLPAVPDLTSFPDLSEFPDPLPFPAPSAPQVPDYSQEPAGPITVGYEFPPEEPPPGPIYVEDTAPEDNGAGWSTGQKVMVGVGVVGGVGLLVALMAASKKGRS